MADKQTEAPKISVSGDGSFFKQPERAVVRINIQHESSDPQEASTKVTQYASSLSSLLKSLSPKTNGVINDNAPVTWWSSDGIAKYSYTPQHNGSKNKRVHRVSQRFEAKFQDFQKLSEIVADCTISPYTDITSINWALTEKTKASMQAAVRTLAVRDATTKAQDYARALGFSDVKIVSLNDSSGGYLGAPAVFARAGMPEASDANLALTPNDVELAASVQCEFFAV